MAANAPCPTCGHVFSIPEGSQGAEVRCPSCLDLVPTRPQPAPALLGRPAASPVFPAAAPPPAAPNRTVLAQAEAMIRYTCVRCKKSLESPASFAGQKLNCPHCNQRLQIPQPSAPPPPAMPPVNKTILAPEESSIPVVTAYASAAPAAPPPVPTASARRESCLECGADLSERQRVQTCADCGVLLCSAGCQREHRHHAHARRKRRQRSEECEYCGSRARPYESTVISQGGWITFAILLVFFFPLFWIGLLMTETQVKCADCGARLE